LSDKTAGKSIRPASLVQLRPSSAATRSGARLLSLLRYPKLPENAMGLNAAWFLHSPPESTFFFRQVPHEKVGANQARRKSNERSNAAPGDVSPPGRPAMLLSQFPLRLKGTFREFSPER
jgi:hypothetical protein